MQNTIEKFRQSSIFERPGILSQNFDELQLPHSSIFFTEILHTRFLRTSVYKRVCGIFFISFKKTWFLHTRFLHFY